MLDTIVCPHCDRRLALPPEHREQEVQCPGCNRVFQVADRAAPPAPLAPPAPPAPPTAIAAPVDAVPKPAPQRRRRRRPAFDDATVPRSQPDRPRNRRSGCLTAGLVAGGLVLLAIFLVGAMQKLDGPANFFGGVKDGDDVVIERDIFKPDDGKAVRRVDPGLEQELQPVFASLGAAFRDGAAARIGSHFDIERTADELTMPRLFGDRQALVRGMRQGMEQSLAKQAPLLAWEASEIRHIKQRPNGELVVIVRHRVAGGTSIKMRWWLTKRAGNWRIYDFEDLDIGMRVSVTVGGLLAGGVAKMQGLPQHAASLREALLALATQNDADAAERKLQAIGNVELPRPLEAVRWMVKAMVQLHRNQPQAALDALHRAHDYHADMPALDLLKGMAYNRLAQWDKALKHIDAYQDLLGDDANVNRERGEALRGLNRVAEARAAYRQSLDENPKDADAFIGLLRTVAPPDELPDLGQRFAKLDALRENFDMVFDDCRQERDYASLDQIAEAMHKIDPAYAPAHFARALVKAWAGEAEPATTHFRAGLAAEKDPGKRTGQTTLFLQAMASAGLARQAYAVAPERRAAFQILTAEMRKAFRMENLRPLVAAHARADAADPLLPWYQGEVFVQAGQFAAAEKAFVAGMAQPPDAVTLAGFRTSRVQAKYHCGQALAAYAKIAPAKETFRQLADLADADRKDALLQELIDAHSRVHADDMELHRFRVRLKLRQGDVAAAITTFHAAAKQGNPEQRRQLAFDFINSMIEAGKAMEAYRASPNAMEAFPMLAAQLRSRGRLPELYKLIEVHRKEHADDAVALAMQTAALHRRERQWDKAAAVLEDIWPRVPDKQRNEMRHDYVYALAKAGRALDAYEKISPRADTFREIAYLLLREKKTPELLTLIEKHRPHARKDPEVELMDARAKVLAKRPAEAVASWQSACSLQSNAGQRRYYIEEFVREMHLAGDGMTAYRNAPDKAVAFEALARQLVAEKKADLLERLLAEQDKEGGAAPWRLFFQGELALLRNRADEAEPFFRRALAEASGILRHAFRMGHYRAQIRRGKTAEAYAANGSSPHAFEDLAGLCVTEKNAGQLVALIAAHRKADPDDPDLAAWDVEAKVLAEDYAGALALLTEQRETLARTPRFSAKFDRHLVRSLVKLKRHEQAVREAKKLIKQNRFHGRLLLIFTYASAGHVKEAMRVAEESSMDRFLLSDCYHDADLGPLLRGDALRAFRERFPEPPADELDLDDDDRF